MKVAISNIRSVKIHTLEPPSPCTGGDGGVSSTQCLLMTNCGSMGSVSLVLSR